MQSYFNDAVSAPGCNFSKALDYDVKETENHLSLPPAMTREPWMKDSHSTHCYSCESQFKFLVRRHHCRRCGRVFCHWCTQKTISAGILLAEDRSRGACRDENEKKRVCDHCYREALGLPHVEPRHPLSGHQRASYDTLRIADSNGKGETVNSVQDMDNGMGTGFADSEENAMEMQEIPLRSRRGDQDMSENDSGDDKARNRVKKEERGHHEEEEEEDEESLSCVTGGESEVRSEAEESLVRAAYNWRDRSLQKERRWKKSEERERERDRVSERRRATKLRSREATLTQRRRQGGTQPAETAEELMGQDEEGTVEGTSEKKKWGRKGSFGVSDDSDRDRDRERESRGTSQYSFQSAGEGEEAELQRVRSYYIHMGTQQQELSGEDQKKGTNGGIRGGGHGFGDAESSNMRLWVPPPPETDERDKDEEERVEEVEDDEEEGGDGERMGGETSLNSDDEEEREGSVKVGQGRKGDENNEQGRSGSTNEGAFQLRDVVDGHFRALVEQMLKGEEGLLGPDGWLDVVGQLALEAANHVKPDTSKGGCMDPGEYVKVKCVATGQKKDSYVVGGIVCRKNVANRRMESNIEKPHMLILGGALEYQRITNQLSSMETLLAQQEKHLVHVLEQVERKYLQGQSKKNQQPQLSSNLLLVEKTVSGFAQEWLLRRKISLVYNIKQSLLERISRCVGAKIATSAESLSSLGHCKKFYTKRFVEEHNAGPGEKKTTKTLMFFDGCPQPLGCTILLMGGPTEELKKVKRVVHYAVFAAYHLALETSFLADEGAFLSEPSKGSAPREIETNGADGAENGAHRDPQKGQLLRKSGSVESQEPIQSKHLPNASGGPKGPVSALPQRTNNSNKAEDQTTQASKSSEPPRALPERAFVGRISDPPTAIRQNGAAEASRSLAGPAQNPTAKPPTPPPTHPTKDERNAIGGFPQLPLGFFFTSPGYQPNSASSSPSPISMEEPNAKPAKAEQCPPSPPSPPAVAEYPSPSEHQTILVSVSSRCLPKKMVCESPRLRRIKYYGSTDMPLGTFLLDFLFNKDHRCKSCDKSTESHVRVYTHKEGSITVSVRRVEPPLAGSSSSRIWLWHRCKLCNKIDGLAPSTRRVVMSEAARKLSFGKFLELSFSTHAAASRVAACGHSLHRDCLRFYGCGDMIACFSYSPMKLHTVHLPPKQLQLQRQKQQKWLQEEHSEVAQLVDQVFSRILSSIQGMGESLGGTCQLAGTPGFLSEVKRNLMNHQSVLREEKIAFDAKLAEGSAAPQEQQPWTDIFSLNSLRRDLAVAAMDWEKRLALLRQQVAQQRKKESEEKKPEAAEAAAPSSEASRPEEAARKEPGWEGAPLSPPLKEDDPSLEKSEFVFRSESTRLPFGQPLQAENVAGDSGGRSGEAEEDDKFISSGMPIVRALSSGHMPLWRDLSYAALPSSSSSPSSSLPQDNEFPLKEPPPEASEPDPNAPDTVCLAAEELPEASEPASPHPESWGTPGFVWASGLVQFPHLPPPKPPPKAAASRKLPDSREDSGEECGGERVGGDQNGTVLLMRAPSGRSSAASTQPNSPTNGRVENDGWGSDRSRTPSLRSSSGSFRMLPPLPSGGTPFSSSSKGLASFFSPPLSANEAGPHVTLLEAVDGRVIAVHEHEPTSVIAYALCTDKYRRSVIPGDSEGESGPFRGSDGAEGTAGPGSGEMRSVGGERRSSGSGSLPEPSATDANSLLSSDSKLHVTIPIPEGEEAGIAAASASSASASSASSAPPAPPAPSAAKKRSGGPPPFSVTLYYAQQFEALRFTCFGGEAARAAFVRSLSRCRTWEAQGGKSAVYFAKTADDRFVIKQVQKKEMLSFLDFARDYFKYMSNAFTKGNPTCLAKIMGMFQVSIKGTTMNLMVMENLLYGRNVSCIYDLKGSIRSRYNANAMDPNAVLLDENLLETMPTAPIFVGKKSKQLLERAVWNDTKFLADMDVMDYSLLVGVEEDRHELVLGIIDFIRPYTWDKQLETWVKASGILGGPKNTAPTIISPDSYKNRFRKAMKTYFVVVPDQWTPPPIPCSSSSVALASSVPPAPAEEGKPGVQATDDSTAPVEGANR